MAIPNAAISEIAATTIESRTGELADNVTKNNALLARLRSKGRMKTVSGGRQIFQELQYQENQSYKRYSGYESLNIAPSDVFTAANFDFKQSAVAISISGLEMLQNGSKEAIIDLLESRIENAEATMANNISIDCYSDGTADSGKQIGGLQFLIPDAPTSGVVGGIDRAVWAFWQSQKFGGVADGGGATSTSNIQSYMNRLYMKLCRGADRPDLILADNTYYRLYLESLQAIQRISSNDSAMVGFMNLKYMDSDVVFDGGFGGGAPAAHMYFLNSKYIFFRPHADRNFVALEPDRFAVNQDAMVKLIAFAGNMTLSNSFLQGVLIA